MSFDHGWKKGIVIRGKSINVSFSQAKSPKKQSPKPSNLKPNTRMNSIKSFFQQRHNFGRHPFAAPGHSECASESFWGDFKSFFTKQHRFGRRPFAAKV